MTQSCTPAEENPPESWYRERCLYLLGLVNQFGGALSYNDPELPDWPVLYIETPEGQLSRHINADDLELFHHVPVVVDYPWDGHTRKEYCERLERLVMRLPKMTYAAPEYGAA